MLGHHRGDLIESVLSNKHNGNEPLNLLGISAISMKDAVSIYRPILHLDKVNIYHYMHRSGVPYFKETSKVHLSLYSISLYVLFSERSFSQLYTNNRPYFNIQLYAHSATLKHYFCHGCYGKGELR